MALYFERVKKEYLKLKDRIEDLRQKDELINFLLISKNLSEKLHIKDILNGRYGSYAHILFSAGKIQNEYLILNKRTLSDLLNLKYRLFSSIVGLTFEEGYIVYRGDKELSDKDAILLLDLQKNEPLFKIDSLVAETFYITHGRVNLKTLRWYNYFKKNKFNFQLTTDLIMEIMSSIRRQVCQEILNLLKDRIPNLVYDGYTCNTYNIEFRINLFTDSIEEQARTYIEFVEKFKDKFIEEDESGNLQFIYPIKTIHTELVEGTIYIYIYPKFDFYLKEYQKLLLI